MRHPLAYLTTALAVLALAACSGGTVKRVSEPSASIQQLTVAADGQWEVQLRLRNYSSMPMRYDRVTLEVTVGDQVAGTLEAAPALSIGPESADVITATVQPSSAARLVVADTLAGARSLPYQLKGSLAATPDERKQRTFDITSRNSLSPAPGLTGVLR